MNEHPIRQDCDQLGNTVRNFRPGDCEIGWNCRTIYNGCDL